MYKSNGKGLFSKGISVRDFKKKMEELKNNQNCLITDGNITDNNINDVVLTNRIIYDSITNLGQKSDYLRYHILNQFGGIYVDTDFECLKSFDSLSYVDFLVGVGYRAAVQGKKLVLSLGFSHSPFSLNSSQKC